MKYYVPFHACLYYCNEPWVVTGVVNGQAWDNVTTHFLPLCKSRLIFILLTHSDEGLVGGTLYGVRVVVNVLDLITDHLMLCMWW